MSTSLITYSKSDKASLWFVAWMWSFHIWPYLLSVVRRIPVLKLFTHYTIPAISIILALFAIANNRNKLKNRDIVFCLTVMFVYIVHIVAFPNNATWLFNLLPFFFYTCLPYFIVGLFVDFDKQKNVLEYISMVVILLNLVYRYFINTSLGDDFLDTTHGDDMGTAYRLLPHMLLLLYSILQKFNIWKTVFVIVAFIVICGTGNRGSLLLISLFFTFYFLLLKQYRHPILSRFLIVLGGLFVFSYLPNFAQFMSDYLLGLDLGFSDRAFRFYLDGEIAYDNGRDEIKTILFKELEKSPLFGYGLCGDRVLTGLWAHDLMLELWVSFGYLFGSILFARLVLVVIQSYFKSSTINEKGFLLVLFLLGFVVLFISNSFLQNRYFWLLLGYCICLRRKPMISINNSLSN